MENFMIGIDLIIFFDLPSGITFAASNCKRQITCLRFLSKIVRERKKKKKQKR